MTDFNDRLQKGAQAKAGSQSLDTIAEEDAARVLKILSLAKDGATEGEMDAALAAAFKLAAKYDLDLTTMTAEEIETRRKGLVRDPIIEKRIKIAKGAFRRPPCWKFVARLLDGYFKVSVLTGCGSFSSMVYIYGKKSDVERAHYVMDFLIARFNKDWREYRDRTGSEPSSRASFFRGMWLAIDRKLQLEEHDAKERAYAEAQSRMEREEFENRYSLVVGDSKKEVQDFVEQTNKRIVYVKNRERTDVDHRALDAGHKAGKEVSFVDGIASGSAGELGDRKSLK